jgi:GAF domain-containing protein
MYKNSDSGAFTVTGAGTSGTEFDRAYQQATRMLETDTPQREILAFLTSVAEGIAGRGAVSSILVLDNDGFLRNGASPRLPADFLRAIDRLKPNPRVGTCAAAAGTGSVVITPDFCADDKWAELRHLPCALGFVGAWSMPIKNSSGAILGTFGTYFREQRRPSSEEVKRVELLAGVAATAICNESCGNKKARA